MKLIVAGSRTFDDYQLLENEIDKFVGDQTIDCIVSGCARGADRLGEDYAKFNQIKIAYFPANWDKYGRAAGCIRNEEMAKFGTHCIVFVVNDSRGSTNMIKLAQKYNLVTKVIRI